MSAVLAILAARKKAIAAFVAPIIVVQAARFIPGVHLDASIVDQLIVAVITAFTVHTTTNKGA